MNKNELESIVMNLITSIEEDIEDIKMKEDKRISELRQEFSELSEQLTKLTDLQTRLESATNKLDFIAQKISNL